MSSMIQQRHGRHCLCPLPSASIEKRPREDQEDAGRPQSRERASPDTDQCHLDLGLGPPELEANQFLLFKLMSLVCLLRHSELIQLPSV